MLRVTDLDDNSSWYLTVAGHEIFGKNYRVFSVIFGEPYPPLAVYKCLKCLQHPRHAHFPIGVVPFDNDMITFETLQE